jgi:hypothetical protein
MMRMFLRTHKHHLKFSFSAAAIYGPWKLFYQKVQKLLAGRFFTLPKLEFSMSSCTSRLLSWHHKRYAQHSSPFFHAMHFTYNDSLDVNAESAKYNNQGKYTNRKS